jgi:hypothetical protein
MVRHWHKTLDASHRHVKMFINGLGAVATAISLLIIVVTKFIYGAWVTVLLVPFLIWIMQAVKRHYTRVHLETLDPTPLRLTGLEPPIVVIPMARWDKITEKAMRFGMLMSPVVKVIHVDSDDADALGCVWDKMELVTVKSTYRTILSPLMDYVLELEDLNPGRKIAVLLPELVVKHWWENLLHNQRVQLLKLLLLLKGNQRIVVVNIPWYL